MYCEQDSDRRGLGGSSTGKIVLNCRLCRDGSKLCHALRGLDIPPFHDGS